MEAPRRFDQSDVRPLLPDELGSALGQRVARLYRDRITPTTDGLLHARQVMDSPGATTFAALDNGRLAGAATCKPTLRNPNETYVTYCAVTPSYERRGVASALLTAVADSVQANSGHALTGDPNPASIPLIRSLGWEPTSLDSTTWKLPLT